MPHIVLKYSPKGEGFHPSHSLEIKQLLDGLEIGMIGYAHIERRNEIMGGRDIG